MYKKLLLFLLFILLFQITKAQNEFITIWKPGTAQQVQFPGRGANFYVYWEEIGYPQHNGIINNVTSAVQFPINFGTSLNPVPSNTSYRVKISNGNGSFNQIKFFDGTLTPGYTCPDREKITEVAQWGNIQWQTFEDAFVFCPNLDVTAQDAPNLALVTSTKEMFYLCPALVGNPSFSTWNTSSVTTMFYMFGEAYNFNQPLDNWNVSSVTDMSYMFDYASSFNQPLSKWNTGSVMTMEHMFHGAGAFNQNIKNWNTSNVTNMNEIFHNADNFNQNLGQWNLVSLKNAKDLFLDSGMSCQNYDNTIYGWSLNPATPNNIDLSSVSPLIYSHPAAVTARNNLINNKGWTISGDTFNGQCVSVLSTSEIISGNELSVYPNPSTDFIYIKNLKGINTYKIFETSGRIVQQDVLKGEKINISSLATGNYVLQVIVKDKIQTFKFIKK
jgi:surface protein